MNKWSKYTLNHNETINIFYDKILDGRLEGSRLSGFQPCEKMEVREYKLNDVFEAFELLDTDGSKWAEADYNIQKQIELISKVCDIKF